MKNRGPNIGVQAIRRWRAESLTPGVGFMKMNRTRKRILIATVCLLAPTTIMFALVLVPRAQRRAEDTQCGRERAVARYLVGYLRQHPNSWPVGWSDLRASMDPQLVNADECIAAWQQCVDVDWSLSPSDFRGIVPDAVPQAIRYRDALAHGRVAARTPEHKREPEPNLLIWELVNSEEANQEVEAIRR